MSDGNDAGKRLLMSALLKIEETDCRAFVRDEKPALPEDFALASGEALSKPYLRLRIHGDSAKPAIVVAGGISAGRVVADSAGEKGWWRDFVAPGRAIDLNDYCVVGFDFLPNAEETARTISTADQARALGHALTAYGIERLFAFVGSSYGGMVALAFAAGFPRRVENLIVISAAEKPHPFGTAMRGVQRRIVEFGAANG
jgi:homoserine O-acetyltransferase